MRFSEFRNTLLVTEEYNEKKSNEKIRDLELLLEIISKVNQTLNIDDVLNLVIRNALKLTNSDKGCIFLYNPATEKLEFKIGFDSENKILSEKSFMHSRTVVNDVFNCGQAMLLENALNDSFYSQCKSILNLELQTILCAPLQNVNGKIGVVYVDSQKLNDVKKINIIETFEIMAGQVTTSIINAKLHGDLQKLSKIYTRNVLTQMKGDKNITAKFLGITTQKLDALLA